MYRGEVYGAEHEPILDLTLFEAVQGKLAAQAVARRCRLRGPRVVLSGRLFDSFGNRMSPSHTNKGGVRYRYYVSQVVLQGKPQPAGLVSRVPAAEVEAFVVAALRDHLSASAPGEQLPENDLELLERHLERVTLTSNHLELRLRQTVEPAHNAANKVPSALRMADIATITVPWTSPLPAAVKGIIHVPRTRRWRRRIARAFDGDWAGLQLGRRVGQRRWQFGQLASEGKAERHIRLLLPFAFVSPQSSRHPRRDGAGRSDHELVRALPGPGRAGAPP